MTERTQAAIRRVLGEVGTDANTMRARANGDGELGRRIAHVDGLRAVAVLLVVACHTAKWDPRLGQGPALQALLQGTHGVDLFFVLSGFLSLVPSYCDRCVCAAGLHST